MQLRPPLASPSGQLVQLKLRSELLQGNPLGDPCEREHPVYLPPGYASASARYPVLYCLAAYTNAGPGQVAWRNHGETLPQRLDRLISSGAMPPAIVVFPDCYTSLGGNQYVNSAAIGRYADFLLQELIPAVDASCRSVPEAAARGVFGKSSGGFGALHLVSNYPGHFAVAASHAGDCGFDRVYQRDFPLCCDVLARYQGDLPEFVRAFWRKQRPGHADFHALMTLCLAASYSPQPGAPLNLALPFDLHTCALRPDIWSQWLAFDPLEQAEGSAQALRELAGLWIDAGSRDQYFIHYGTRELHARWQALNIAHEYEEFDGSHSGIDWRYDKSLPWMAQRLAAATS
ncbi:MAG: alpha/beta hydrolase [Wenzhouxiangella sp.]